MIKNEKEYKNTLKKIEKGREVIEKQKTILKEHGLTANEIKRALEPMLVFQEELSSEAKWYESVKKRDFRSIHTLNDLGRLLIALRIASGLTQQDLGRCLGVSESQVSRDEVNEYYGISLERVKRILGVFGVHIETKVAVDRPLQKEKILEAAMN